MEKDDFVKPQDLVYTGNDLTSQALELIYPNKRKPAPGIDNGIEIVTDGWSPT